MEVATIVCQVTCDCDAALRDAELAASAEKKRFLTYTASIQSLILMVFLHTTCSFVSKVTLSCASSEMLSQGSPVHWFLQL